MITNKDTTIKSQSQRRRNKKRKTKGHSIKRKQEAKAIIRKAKAIVNDDVTKSKSKTAISVNRKPETKFQGNKKEM